MWSRLFLVLLVGAASAEHFQAWKTDTQYQFNVRSRTLTALHDSSDQYTGVIVRALLTIRPKGKDILEAKVSKAHYAQIHTKLPDGWKSEIPDSMLDFKLLPMSEGVFEIKMSYGVVRDLIVDKDVPTWEVNVLKSIVSQLQVDTQGENLRRSRYNQAPEKDRVNFMYKTMEDSVGGKCEVLYDINVLPDFVLRSRPELIPKSELRGEGGVIEIIKTKNYCKCEEHINYRFGISESNDWDSCTNENGKFSSKSSVSQIVITGDLSAFTIQSSVMTHEVALSPSLYERKKGMVGSRVNVTLANMGPISSGSWLTAANPKSVGNLVYSHDNPWNAVGEDRHDDRINSIPKTFTSEEEWNVRNSDKSLDNDYDAFTLSRSSSSESSFESNERRSYWQPPSNLNDAPFTPLLPYFKDNKEKSKSSSGEVDPVAMAQTLANEIGSEFEHPNTMSEEQTLDKFTILTQLLRTMNTEQIAEAQRGVFPSENKIESHDEAESSRLSSWAAFRDAVAQAGTGPALVTIKNWIKEKKIAGLEAALVVGVLSKTARAPTPAYVDAFFEMVTMPETTNEEFLNSTAMVTFGELVRYSQVNHNSLSPPSSKHNAAIFREYIPYMSEQLKKSIENEEFAKSHAFICALGNIAHPRILNVFEPYLERVKPASTFQRLLMVFSMNNLATLRPRLARAVFYRIYQNTAETHQLRSAAVNLLMSTNPPASMLQRMAEFTNYDHSRSVSAAVKSAIEAASKLETPKSQDLAMKARNVLSLLNKDSYDSVYADSFFSDYDSSEWSLAYRMQAYLASDDLITLALYATLNERYGSIAVPKYEIGGLVSSLRDFYSVMNKLVLKRFTDDDIGVDKKIEFSTKNIEKLLKMEKIDDEKFESVFWSNSMFNNRFAALDKKTLLRIPEFLTKVGDSIAEGRNFNIAKTESYDLSLSFPMESGFPFLYTLKVPVMTKLSGSIKGDAGDKVGQASVDLRLVHSMHVQGRLGFLMPFEHHHYMAGVDKNMQLHVPIRVEAKSDPSVNRLTLKFQPIDQKEKFKLAQYSVVPFTSRHDILNMSPVMKDKDTRIILNGEPWVRSNRGMNLNFKVETESLPVPGSGMDVSNWDPLARLMFALAEDNPYYIKSDITYEPDDIEKSIILTASVATFFNHDLLYDEERSKLSPKATAPTVKSKKINDSERMQQLGKEALTGISDGHGIAFDFGLELPMKEPSQMLLTVAYASSLIDEKSRGLAYWRIIHPEQHIDFESCLGMEAKTPRTDTYATQDRLFPQDGNKFRHFDVDLRLGETCENGYQIRVHGDQEQTEQYKKAVLDLPVVSECMHDVQTGAKCTSACVDAADKLYTMDKSRMTIKFDPRIENFQEEVYKVMAAIGFLSHTEKFSVKEIDSNDKTAPGDNVLALGIDVEPSNNLANFSVATTERILTIKDIDIPLGPIVMNFHNDLSDQNERILMNLTDVDDLTSTCEFVSNKVSTFDKATYPAELGKCWHVAVAASTTTRIRHYYRDLSLNVLIRDSDSIDGMKDVQIVVERHVVKFMVVDSKIVVTVDGETVDIKNFNNEGRAFSLHAESDGSVKFTFYIADFEVIYDGKRVQIKVDEAYRNDVRGLCGNYDGERSNDFKSPRDCTLSNPEEFVGSFALTSKDCEGPAVENSKKAQARRCHMSRSGNVITDREAGRSKSGDNSWGFHNRMNRAEQGSESGNSKRCTTMRTKVIEEDDQTCFSLRPMPTCSSGCKATVTKPKVMPVYCLPKNAASQQMVERIKQGANPDLTQKTPSKKSGFDIPVHCHA